MQYSCCMRLKMTLRAYIKQRGLFARVARKLRVDPSVVSRVANGIRRNDRISEAVDAELDKMQRATRKSTKSQRKK